MQAKSISALVVALAVAQFATAQTCMYETVDARGLLGPAGSITQSWPLRVSADGEAVLFATQAPHFDPSAPAGGLFVRERRTGALERVSIAPTISQFDLAHDRYGAMSADARFVVFTLGNRVYRRDRANATTDLVSVSLGGAPSAGIGPLDVSNDGRFVVFRSGARDLVASNPCGGTNLFVRDMQLQTTERIDVSIGGTLACNYTLLDQPVVSGDGRYVGFEVAEWLGGGQVGPKQVYVRDLQLSTTELISQSTAGAAADGDSTTPFVSDDGRWVTFTSTASNLSADNTSSLPDIFLRDRLLGTTQLVSPVHPPNPDVEWSWQVAPITPDGRFVAFTTNSPAVAPNDINGDNDVVVYEVATGTYACASQKTNGNSGNYWSMNPAISDDGRWVVFASAAKNLALTPAGHTTFNILTRDMAPQTATAITTYCTAKVNSLGCTPVMSATGKASVVGETLLFAVAEHVMPQATGQLVWSSTGTATTPFHGGVLCIAAPLHRTPIQLSTGQVGQCDGTYSFRFDASYLGAAALAAGQEIFAQYYQRDSGFAAPNAVGLSDGIRFTIGL